MADQVQEQGDTASTTEGRPEYRWIDASIRWDDFVDEEKEGFKSDCLGDPFADPNPQETFVFANDGIDTNIPPIIPPIEIRLEGFKSNADQVWQSTGLTLWKAAYELSRYLLQHSDCLRGQRVLELGAGLGLCGILAHQLQACHSEKKEHGDQATQEMVYITDGDSETLVKLRENVAANQRSGRVRCHQLLWGEAQAQTFARIHGTMTVLLASDIVYVSTIVPPLWETVQVLLERRGVFFFAFDSRRDVPVTIEYVLQEADLAGFAYEIISDDLYKFQWKK